MELIMEHLGKGFLITLLVAMPVVLTAAGIGLVVGILQAVTQVQEQTIAAAPKILGVFLVIIILGGFFEKTLDDYLIESFNIAFKVVLKQDSYVLGPEGWPDDNKSLYSGLKKPTTVDFIKKQGNLPYARKMPEKILRSPSSPSYKPNLIEDKRQRTGR